MAKQETDETPAEPKQAATTSPEPADADSGTASNAGRRLLAAAATAAHNVRSIPLWAQIAIPAALVAGALVGTGITMLATPAVADTDEYQTLTSAHESLEKDLERTNSQLSNKNDQAERLQREVSQYEDEQDSMDAMLAEIEQREADVTAREIAVTGAEAAKKANEFGSGTHLVGTDIQPGTYRTAGTGSCYWERLSGLGGGIYDIIANGLPEGQAVVTIGAGDLAFKSQGCGTWTKIG